MKNTPFNPSFAPGLTGASRAPKPIAAWTRFVQRVIERSTDRGGQSTAFRNSAIECLESRISPATFTGVGPVLSIDLNNSNEVVSFSTDGTTISATLTGGTATDGGGTGGNVAGFGTSSATITSAGFTSITITDSSTGDSVEFSNSSGSYPQAFTINLNDPASGHVAFSGGSTFTATFNATTVGGFFASDIASSLTLSGAGANLAITATGHDVLLKGAVAVGGTTSITANVVQIDNAANDFTGAFQLTGPVVASVHDANDLNLAASSLSFGNVGQKTQISADGNITQSGALTASASAAATLEISSTGGSITLANAGNSLAANVALALSVTGTNTATFSNSPGGNTALTLGDVTLGTGALTLTSNGNIVQKSATTIETGGAVSLTIAANNHDILLGNSGNRIAGTVTVAESAPGFLRDLSLRNADDHATVPTGTPLTTAGDVRNLTLFFDNNGIALPGYNITGNLSVTAGGDITQTAGLTIGGSSTATILGDFGIDLSDPANAFSGSVTLKAPQSTQPVSVVNSSGLALAGNLGRGAFNATALSGNISESGAITQEKGSAPTTFTVTGSNTITLNNAGNDFTGNVVLAGAGLATANILNTDFQAQFSALTIPATVTDLTVTFSNTSMVLPTLSPNNLTVNAQGIVQQSGASLTISGNSTFNGNAFPIDLSNAANDFNNLQLQNSGHNDVRVTDANGVAFNGNSNIGTGKLTVLAGGSITEPARITQNGAGPAGDVSFTSTGGSVTLNGTNGFVGPISVAVSGANTVSVNNSGVALVLGQVTTGSGSFTATAGNQGITQDPNSVLSLGGTSSFTATGGGASITLANHTNTFSGAVALSASNATVHATGALALDVSSVGGTLNIVTGGTAADSVTQIGAITGGSGATFDVGAGSVTLTNAGNNFASVSVFSTGASVSITDSGALNVGTIKVGGGTLTLTTGGNLGTAGGGSIVQTAGTGAITLNTPAGNNIGLNSALNALLGTVTVVQSNNVTLRTQGDLSFTNGSIINGSLTATSGGILTLPGNLTTLSNLTTSAVSTTVASDITTSAGGIAMTGSVVFTGDRILTSGGGITFTGDVTAGGTLTLNAAANQTIQLVQGNWNQGINALTINGNAANFTIGDSAGDPAAFNMTSGTISMPGGGNVLVQADGVLRVGSAATPEIVTLANGAGNLTINGALGVGFGATNDQLIKTGSGRIALGANSRLLGSGLADANASPVLVSQTGLLTGRFVNSVDTSDAPRDFFAGSDIVTPAYDFTQLTVKSGGTASATGKVTGFLPDGDKFTVVSSLGATPGLVVVQDLAGQLEIVVRNTNAPGASTLTISTTGGGDGQVSVGDVMVHAPGSVAITAPTANFSGSVTTAGKLTSLTARDLMGASALTPFVLTDGGLTTGITSITARDIQMTTIDLAGALGAFKAVSVTNGVKITAEKFGTIATTGDPAGTNPAAPGVPDPGDFNATLTSSTPVTGAVLTSAKIAGTLSGTWDLRGGVGTVTASKTANWTLGTLGAANVQNGGLLTNATGLTLGPVSGMVLNATGVVAALTTSDIGGSQFTAGSFGAVKVIAKPALGLVGDVNGSTFTATSNAAGVAMKSLTIAGDLTNSALVFDDGNANSIAIARTMANSSITADDANNHGMLKLITAGRWQSTSIDARTIGTLNVTGNLVAGLFGDFTGSTVTLRGNTGGVALGTFMAKGSVSSSSFNVQSGNVTTFKVGRQFGSTAVNLTDAAFGNLGTIQAGDWTNGVSVVAKTISKVASLGAAATAPASPLLLGGISGDTINAYLETGTAPAIGMLITKGDLANTSVNAGHGIGSATIGRSVTGSSIIADDAMGGAVNVGRIPTLTAGAWTNSMVSANSLGKVQIIGYQTPENSAASFQFGDVTNGIFLAHGATQSTPTGIGSFSAARNVQNSVLDAPFGIKTLTVGGSLAASKVVTNNPVTPAGGFIGTLTAGDLAGTIVRAGSILTLKTTGSAANGLLGDIDNSVIAVNSTVAAPGGAQALGTLSVIGDFSDSLLDAPAKVGKITVLGRIASVSTETRVEAGYVSGSKLGSLTTGAWGQPGSVFTTDLVSQSVGTFALKGNVHRGFVGTADGAFIDILGNIAGVGLGTFSATGTVSNSLFRVSDGDVTSFTAERLISSDLLVGYRFVKASDITAAPTAAQWAATNHKIGKFATTAPFDPTDPTDSASFVDSNVIAAILGSINLSGVDSATINATAFGVAFRASAGAGAAGVVKANGSPVALTAPATNGQFDYLGLVG